RAMRAAPRKEDDWRRVAAARPRTSTAPRDRRPAGIPVPVCARGDGRCPARRGTVSAMIRHARIARAKVWALLLALVVTACGGAKPATGPEHGVGVAAVGPAAGSGSAQGPAGPTSAPDPDAAVLPLWPEVKRGTLPNGLTYYILKHQKPEKRAFLWLAVNA